MNDAPPYRAATTTSPRRWTTAAGVTAILLLLLVPRWISIFTESINWDEFTMLERVYQTLRHGELVGAGRPGLVVLMLTPFVRDCVDAITTAARARILWQVITLAYLCGVFFLVRSWFSFSRRPERGSLEGAATVALLAFLPAFVAWSVQVRSDQAALAAAVWGGVFLLSEQRRLAILSGLLFGLSLLCTQKAIYPAALCGVLWASATTARMRDPSLVPLKSEMFSRVAQILIVGMCAAATIAFYAYLVPKAAGLIDKGSVLSAWEEMRLARVRLGFRAYTTEAMRAPLHILLFLGLIAFTGRALFRRAYEDGHLLGTSWAILMLGIAVIIVHGSSYPYFLMTAGLFPAVALGIVTGHMSTFLGKRRKLILALVFLSLVLGSAQVTLEMLDGSQKHQRDTIRWIKASGLSAHQGFQIDGALICLADSDPIRPLSHQLNMGQLPPTAFDELIDEFRRRPVAYVVDADRLGGFPHQVQQFWSEHYRWYHGAVSVAGFDVQANSETDSVDVIVPGEYRWIPKPRNQRAVLEVDGKRIAAGSTAPLTVGLHRFTTSPKDVGGILVLDLEPASETEVYSFIDARQLDRLYSIR